MKDYKILWIDDDWAKESTLQYKILEENKSSIEMSRKNIVVTTKHLISDAYLTLNKTNSYNFLILDLEFNNEDGNGSEYDFTDLLQTLLIKGIRFAIFTSKRKKYVNELNSALKSYSHLLIDIYEKGIDDEKLTADIHTVSRFQNVRIAHLSDIHYDSTLVGKYSTEQEKRINNLIKTLEEEHQKKEFDFILICGDFANKNPKSDFKECVKYIRKIIKTTLNDFSKLLIVPGNHDIQWEDYGKGIISKQPCKPFYEFLYGIYDGDDDIISNLYGYNNKVKDFDNSFGPDSFSWSRNFNHNQVRVIGLNSETIDPDKKGKGIISERGIKFIEQEWNYKPPQSEIRIVLFHHNILPPSSNNSLDVSDGIINSGQMIKVLSDCNCNVLLSGHCHDTYIYQFSYHVLEHNKFSETKQLTYISGGTSGGYSPTIDRARSFNIIEIYPSSDPDSKLMSTTPYIYDSKITQWITLETIANKKI